MCPCCTSDDESVLLLGNCTGKVSVLRALFVMVVFCDREYSTQLIFELVDGLRSDHAIEACQLSRREISMLYAALLLDVVILVSFRSVFGM